MWYDESGALAIFHVSFSIYKLIGAKPQSSGLVTLACFSAKGALLGRTQVCSFANATARAAAREAAPKRAQNIAKIVNFSKKSQQILTFWPVPRWTTDTTSVQIHPDYGRNAGSEKFEARHTPCLAQAE